MKIRQGFVSNSSSSSFIVAFPKGMEPTNENVHEHLFGGAESTITAYEWIGTFSTTEIANQVAQDIRAQAPNIDERIMEALGGHIPGGPDMDQFRKRKPEGGYEYDWDGFSAANEAFRMKRAESVKKEFAGADVYTFEYSDNDGSFMCTMEHGGIFDNLPHLRISNH